MKKFFAIAIIAASLTACGGGETKTEENVIDSAAAKVDSAVSTVSATLDSAAAKVDSAAAKVDSLVKKVEEKKP